MGFFAAQHQAGVGSGEVATAQVHFWGDQAEKIPGLGRRWQRRQEMGFAGYGDTFHLKPWLTNTKKQPE